MWYWHGGEPHDVNTNAAAYFKSESRLSLIRITTEEKSVTVDTLKNSIPNTVAKGEKGISILKLVLINSKDDPNSNEVEINGIKVKIKDKDERIVDDPGTAISRISVINSK